MDLGKGDEVIGARQFRIVHGLGSRDIIEFFHDVFSTGLWL